MQVKCCGQHAGPKRRRRGVRLLAACSIRPASSEATLQVKCCGDTPVRHTGVVGFNSHHLLDSSLSSSAGSSGRMVRGRSPVRFRREALRRFVLGRAGISNASLAQLEVATAS